LKPEALLQIALKMIIFRDKYYSRITKLYYFGIYVKLILDRGFTMSAGGLFRMRKCFVYYTSSKIRNVKNGWMCSCPHVYPHVLLIWKLIDGGLATSDRPMSLLTVQKVII